MNAKWMRTTPAVAVAGILCLATLPAANAAMLQLSVTGTTNGAWFGFPDTPVSQTSVYDTDAVPITQTFANVAKAAYPLVSYELKFGGTTLTPTGDWGGANPSPMIDITDTTPGGPFGNPDAFNNGAALNESFAGFTLSGFLLYSFDYGQMAITNTLPPTSDAYFNLFAFTRIVQIDVHDAAGTNYGMSLSNLSVTLTPVPEPAAALLLSPLGLLAIRRRS